MRFLVIILTLIWAFPVSGQADKEDPFALSFVRTNLRIASKHGGGEIPSVVKDFQRLGDGTAIALIKILDGSELIQPEAVKNYLPLIRESFSYPPIISIEANKKPRVTSLLLRYLENSLSDPGLRQNIKETAEFVRQKGGS